MQQSFSSQPHPAMPLLAAGDSGPDVQRVQQLLNREGALLADDGQFGPATASAVRACQSRHGLKVTGMLDPGPGRHVLPFRNPAPVWTSVRPVSLLRKK